MLGPGITAHPFSLGTWEAPAVGSLWKGQPSLYSEHQRSQEELHSEVLSQWREANTQYTS